MSEHKLLLFDWWQIYLLFKRLDLDKFCSTLVFLFLILFYRKIGPHDEGNVGAARDFPRTQPIYLYLASTDILLICNAWLCTDLGHLHSSQWVEINSEGYFFLIFLETYPKYLLILICKMCDGRKNVLSEFFQHYLHTRH